MIPHTVKRGLGWQERVHQGLHLHRHSVGDQSGADGTALGGEVLRVGELDRGRDGFGVRRGGGEVAVQRVGVVVFGDGQRPDEIVKVALVPLAVRLKIYDLRQSGGAVEQGDQVPSLVLGSSCRPVGLVLDYCVVAEHAHGTQTCAGRGVEISRLHATLALVKSASAMPWSDQLAIIREDNAFRCNKDVLPPDEGAALWAEFDAEMNRLYAIMNEGKEPDLDD